MTQAHRKTGLPKNFRHRSTLRQQIEHVFCIGDGPETVTRERDHEQHLAFGAHDQIALSVSEGPVHADIGQAPAVGVAFATKTEPQRAPDAAMRSIAAQQIIGQMA